MNFYSGASIDGQYVFGYENGWHWTKNRGHYNNGRDFFWVHWEINEHVANCIKLHVECPKMATDSGLNDIKKELVAALLSGEFKNIVEDNGWEYIAGTRAKPHHIEKNKSTQPFRIMLPERQLLSTHEANIGAVHTLLGSSVDEVISCFKAQLKREFLDT